MPDIVVLPSSVFDFALLLVYALGLAKGAWWSWAMPRIIQRWKATR